jgi:hypothetical protein
MSSACSICELNHATSDHHLIPVSMKNHCIGNNGKIPVCKKCHGFVHKAFSNHELANELNTLKKLKEDKKIQQFLELATMTEMNFSLRKIKIENDTITCRRFGRKIFEGSIV